MTTTIDISNEVDHLEISRIEILCQGNRELIAQRTQKEWLQQRVEVVKLSRTTLDAKADVDIALVKIVNLCLMKRTVLLGIEYQ